MALDALYLLKLLLRSGPPVATIPQILANNSFFLNCNNLTIVAGSYEGKYLVYCWNMSYSDFFNWNKVKIRYCDGASFAGHPEKLFFRGQLIWETLMDELLSIGLSNARQVKKRTETTRPPKEVQMEYMSLPASQYSVLDAGSIDRVDNSTFRCYVYNFKFFAFEVCPVLLVRVEEEPYGFCIKLLSCNLEGSPIVVAQNEKIDASMLNRVSCNRKQSDSSVDELTSDTTIESALRFLLHFDQFPCKPLNQPTLKY
ncbi:hypothetical protein TEA_003792 [Camellia sinensis var. sinensis]|uniref:Pectin acetylesterase n=1 Tax=Camellia sinensis var. sinensis TaxID=542762 RepID=A0A4S4F3C2_CAMSN|nr:hypothetical protein TEA_003792 [Camellia sinensis var. sinensis]